MNYSLNDIQTKVAIKGQIIRLSKMGKTPAQICNIMECETSYENVIQFLTERGLLEKKSLELSVSQKKAVRLKYSDSLRTGHGIMTTRLAKKLNTSEKLVSEYLDSLGYKPKELRRSSITNLDRANIDEMHKNGISFSEISRQLKINHRTVIAHVHKMNESKWTEEQIQFLKDRLEESLLHSKSPDMQGIATKLKKNIKTIYRKIEVLKLTYFSKHHRYDTFELQQIEEIARIKGVTKNSPEVISHAKKYGRFPKYIMQKISKIRKEKNIKFK